jgi:hypothetical protein
MDFPWVGVFFWVGTFSWFSIIVWTRYMREQERQKTLRAFAERGQTLDPETMKRLFPGSEIPADQRPDSPQSVVRGLMIGGVVTAFVSVGLLIAAQVIGHLAEEARWGLSGASAIVGFTGLGLLTAAYLLNRQLVAGRKAHELRDDRTP